MKNKEEHNNSYIQEKDNKSLLIKSGQNTNQAIIFGLSFGLFLLGLPYGWYLFDDGTFVYPNHFSLSSVFLFSSLWLGLLIGKMLNEFHKEEKSISIINNGKFAMGILFSLFITIGYSMVDKQSEIHEIILFLILSIIGLILAISSQTSQILKSIESIGERFEDFAKSASFLSIFQYAILSFCVPFLFSHFDAKSKPTNYVYFFIGSFIYLGVIIIIYFPKLLKQDDSHLLNSSIRNFNFSTISVEILEQNGIFLISQLVNLSRYELVVLDGMKGNMADHIIEQLSKIIKGYTLL